SAPRQAPEPLRGGGAAQGHSARRPNEGLRPVGGLGGGKAWLSPATLKSALQGGGVDRIPDAHEALAIGLAGLHVTCVVVERVAVEGGLRAAVGASEGGEFARVHAGGRRRPVG